MAELLTGTALRERAEQALRVPLVVALGAHLVDPDDVAAGAACEVSGIVDTGFGWAHGSAVAALGELAAYLALIPHLAPDEHAVTVTVTTQLSSATPSGHTVSAVGKVDRRTRRLAFVQVECSASDDVVARLSLTKQVVPWPG